MRTYDHILIGFGQAALTLLGRLIPTGDSIAVVESGRVGGSCVNTGCTPTKTLIASARAIHQARRGDEFGFRAGDVRVDYARVRERMNTIRHDMNRGLVDWMDSSDNVTLIRAHASFVDGHTLSVGDGSVRGEKIYIDVGSRPVRPAVDGLDEVDWLDNVRLLELEELPEHLVILGGGYVGVEFAQTFRRFGSDVTVIQRADHLLPREDDDVADGVRAILEAEGVRVLLGAEATRVAPGPSGVTVHTGDGPVEGSHLLVATGRRPNSDGLNLDATAVRTDGRGIIQVDDRCRTDEDGVWATGDVIGHGAFTHTSVNDGEIVLDDLFGGDRRLSDRIPIYAVFTDPPLGRVGLTEREALAKGHRVLKGVRAMETINRSIEMAETQGFAKLLVDADSDRVLGAAILGPAGDEIVGMFAAIMHSGVPCHTYRKVVLIHPTVSELMPFVLDGLEPAGEE